MMIPNISGLNIKLLALENSRGLSCQFDIFSCMCARISFLKFLNPETINVLQYSQEFNYSFVFNCSLIVDSAFGLINYHTIEISSS